MNRTRKISGTFLILFSALLAAASLQARPKSAAQSAMDTCDRQLAKDWSFCEGTKDTATRRKCDENAEARWKKCYENAGWVFSVQGQPKLPLRRPSAVNTRDAGITTSGAERGSSPKPRIDAAPASREVKQNRPSPTPTPTPAKKSTWTPYGSRQTGSHMR